MRGLGDKKGKQSDRINHPTKAAHHLFGVWAWEIARGHQPGTPIGFSSVWREIERRCQGLSREDGLLAWFYVPFLLQQFTSEFGQFLLKEALSSFFLWEVHSWESVPKIVKIQWNIETRISRIYALESCVNPEEWKECHFHKYFTKTTQKKKAIDQFITEKVINW